MEHQEFVDLEKEPVEITEKDKTEIIYVHVCEGTVCPKEIPEHQRLIIEALVYYNVGYSKITMFGDWAVNEDGDIINTNKECARYPVFKQDYEKSEKSVLKHLKSKNWFDEKQEETFCQALKFATNTTSR